jgi:hypothetical protein
MGLLAARQQSLRGLGTWRGSGALAVLAAGLLLTHYRIALLLGGWCAVWLIVAILSKALKGGGRASLLTLFSRADLARTSLAAGLAILLAAPWLVRLVSDFTLGIRGSAGRYGPEYYNPERLGTALAHPLLWPLTALSLVGLGLAMGRGSARGMALAVWAAALVALSNPHWLALPGSGLVDSVTALSCLFIAAALGLAVVVDAAGRLPPRLSREGPAAAGVAESGSPPDKGRGLVHGPLGRRFAREAVARLPILLVVAAGLIGCLAMPQLIQPSEALADEADAAAARWIAASLPADSIFAVNASIRHWQPDYVVPSDGGYWLPLLAGRGTTLLPLLYPAERGLAPRRIEAIERQVRALQSEPEAPTTLALLRAAGVTHLYIGSRGGPIDERRVRASPAYHPVYRRGGVSIYELRG